jgi:preprotein translocase subunit SecA
MSEGHTLDATLGELIKAYLSGEGVSVKDIQDYVSIVDARELVHGKAEG